MARGADIHADNEQDEARGADNEVALRMAAQNGHLSVVEFLVGRGADIHADNDFALLVAAKRGHLPVLEFLKAHARRLA